MLNPWLMWFVSSFFFFYVVILRVSPGVMTQELMVHLNVSSTNLGLLSSFFFVSYTALQVVSGFIVDRFGIRWIITISALLCALGMMYFSMSTTLLGAIFARFLIGAGASCGFISAVKLVGMYFPKRDFSRVIGLTNMLGTIGGAFGGYPLAVLVRNNGWINVSYGLGLLGLIIACLAFFILKNNSQRNVERKFAVAFRHVIYNKNIWLIGAISGLMYLPITAFVGLWAIPYIKTVFNVSTEVASAISPLIFIGSAISSIFVGEVALRVRSYKKVIFYCTALATFLFALVPIQQSLLAVIVLFFFIGIALGAQLLCFAWVKDNCSVDDLGAGAGLCNALTMISGLIYQPLLGWILDYFWQGKTSIDGIRIYEVFSYNYIILAIIVSLLLCFILIKITPDKSPSRESV